MKAMEFAPGSNLAAFIDTYWEIKGEAHCTLSGTVIPDGCVDLIINLGGDYVIESEDCTLENEKAYLGGAITECKEGKINPDTHLIGVRFMPAAFSCFYKHPSLHEATNLCVELDAGMIPGLKSLKENFTNGFNRFYSSKLIQPKHYLLPVVESVQKVKGNISVRELAKINCTTVRQLERNFKHHIGLSPKEFINIIRFKFAQQLITSSYPTVALFDIAFECGYYDHAHLSNEIKKYTGMSPSELC